MLLLLPFLSMAQKTHPNNDRIVVSDKEPENWRILSQEDRHLEAASELLYQVQADTSRNAHADYWHIGQMYAMIEDYEKASFYMEKSFDSDDEQYIWYYKGTQAFLRRDKKALRKYAEKLNADHIPYYAGNARTLMKLLNNFDKSYKEALETKSEE